MSHERPWDAFAREKLIKIFSEKSLIIDIGGGLRIDPSKNNRCGAIHGLDELSDMAKKVDYKILDKVADFHPDILGDIHALPFADNSIDAITCVYVLEHVEEPQKAVKEMYRVLKPGGYCWIEVPFLFYYHPMEGYYKDFYRFTYDGLEYLTRDFKRVEIRNHRGALATVMNLLPLFSKKTRFFELIDKLIGKEGSRQTSNYLVFCEK